MPQALPPDLRFWPAVIVASGPSLDDEQCQQIAARRADDACRVIAVNDNYRRIPTADILVAADYKWWKVHDAQIRSTAPRIQRWAFDARAVEFGCSIFFAATGCGLPEKNEPIKRGSSSGYMAIGLAIRWGATHLVLVGFDCQRGAPEPGHPQGRAHWFGDHPSSMPVPQPFAMWADEMDALAEPAVARGVRIANCSTSTAVRKLPRSTLKEELWPNGQK
jgi:hypothetical protein